MFAREGWVNRLYHNHKSAEKELILLSTCSAFSYELHITYSCFSAIPNCIWISNISAIPKCILTVILDAFASWSQEIAGGGVSDGSVRELLCSNAEYDQTRTASFLRFSFNSKGPYWAKAFPDGWNFFALFYASHCRFTWCLTNIICQLAAAKLHHHIHNNAQEKHIRFY